MKRPARLLGIVLALVAITLGAVYVVRNPERATLGDAARQNVGGRFVRLADGVVHYDVVGPDTGRTVVLVHGFSVPYYIWDSTFAALAGAGFRVLRYDIYGRGYSDRPDVAYTGDLFDRQLAQLLDTLGIRGRIDIVGLSMGGPVVAWFADHHPERVRTLTLIDPAAGGRGSVPLAMRLPVIGSYFFQTVAVPTMAEGQRSDFVDPARFPDWADRYRPQMRYRGFGRALRSTLIEGAKVDRDSLYASVGRRGIPSLIIWGMEDKTVPFPMSAEVRRGMPAAEFRPIEHAAHLPHLERASVTNPLLIDFLRRH